jgi:hypothetical protein
MPGSAWSNRLVPAPTEDEDVVVPLQLQPVVDRPGGWRGRSVNLLAVGLAAFVVSAVILGRSLDTGSPRPPAVALASPTPAATRSATPRPTPTPVPTPSPLPAREVIGGRIPSERVPVYADGLRMLDLATGTLEPTAHVLADQVFPVGNNEVVCACTLGGMLGGDATQPGSVRFGRYDLSGQAIVERELLSFADVTPVPDMTSGFNVTSALSADRSTLYVLAAARRPPVWSIDLYAVSVEAGKVVGHRTLGRLPVVTATAQASPTPTPSELVPAGGAPDGVYLWANGLTVAPGGRSVFATVAYSDLERGVWIDRTREWVVPIDRDRPGAPIPVKPADSLRPEDWCLDPASFIDADLLVQACAPGPPTGRDVTYFLRRLTPDGTSFGDLPIPGMATSDQRQMTRVDPAARALFIWDPSAHALGRIDVDTGAVTTVTVPASRLPEGSPLGGQPWIGPSAGLVESPDGQRLFALGFVPAEGPAGRSSGVWVFDARTLELLDHWDPRALLLSLAVSGDGDFVYAAGAPGFDVDGRQRDTPSSVTVYDARTGEIQVVYGAVSDTWLTFVMWR